MTKKHAIISSLLLTGASILIHFLMQDNVQMDKELVGAFSGLLLGFALAILYSVIFKRKK